MFQAWLSRPSPRRQLFLLAQIHRLLASNRLEQRRHCDGAAAGPETPQQLDKVAEQRRRLGVANERRMVTHLEAVGPGQRLHLQIDGVLRLALPALEVAPGGEREPVDAGGLHGRRAELDVDVRLQQRPAIAVAERRAVLELARRHEVLLHRAQHRLDRRRAVLDPEPERAVLDQQAGQAVDALVRVQPAQRQDREGNVGGSRAAHQRQRPGRRDGGGQVDLAALEHIRGHGLVQRLVEPSGGSRRAAMDGRDVGALEILPPEGPGAGIVQLGVQAPRKVAVPRPLGLLREAVRALEGGHQILLDEGPREAVEEAVEDGEDEEAGPAVVDQCVVRRCVSCGEHSHAGFLHELLHPAGLHKQLGAGLGQEHLVVRAVEVDKGCAQDRMLRRQRFNGLLQLANDIYPVYLVDEGR